MIGFIIRSVQILCLRCTMIRMTDHNQIADKMLAIEAFMGIKKPPTIETFDEALTKAQEVIG
ncbi:MAG: hypothetical protein AB7T22_15880 [Calditrichaceae bacterium]